jgi:GNAT superfamily N-acetyltransferase
MTDRVGIDRYGRLLSRWEAGWSLSRGFPPATHVEGGLAVPMGEPGRDIEHIALTVDFAHHARLATLVASSSDAWLTVPTVDRARTEDQLRAAGLEVAAPEWLMRIDLPRHPVAAVPAPYTLDVRAAGAVIIGEAATAEGVRAADARMAVVGKDAVADRVATDAAHRRRGLATALMSALVDRAQRRGAEVGLLIASEEGRRLYERLDWGIVVPIVVAHGRHP